MANIGALSICNLLLSALVLPNALAAEYTLMPSPQTVHVGHFSAALKPVLTINSGDIVTIESVGGPDPADVDASGVVSPSAVPEHVRTIRREVTDRGPGPHILTGPVYINGAMPGGRARGSHTSATSSFATREAGIGPLQMPGSPTPAAIGSSSAINSKRG